jgi:hypothetical protein
MSWRVCQRCKGEKGVRYTCNDPEEEGSYCAACLPCVRKTTAPMTEFGAVIGFGEFNCLSCQMNSWRIRQEAEDVQKTIVKENLNRK